jgi:hypothetical protein
VEREGEMSYSDYSLSELVTRFRRFSLSKSSPVYQNDWHSQTQTSIAFNRPHGQCCKHSEITSLQSAA